MVCVRVRAVRMAPKSWSKNTFGWARAEVLGALVNAVFLVALCFSITVEALKAINPDCIVLSHPPPPKYAARYR